MQKAMGYDFSRSPHLYEEIKLRDLIFRAQLCGDECQKKSPFLSQDCPLQHDHLAVWKRLVCESITEAIALEEITLLMEHYYGFEYLLSNRAFGC
jgi:hypothetical protein